MWQMMRCWTRALFIAAVLQSVVHAQGSIAAGQQGQLPAPVPLPNSPLSAKECGAPWARCGLSIPKGVNCPQVGRLSCGRASGMSSLAESVARTGILAIRGFCSCMQLTNHDINGTPTRLRMSCVLLCAAASRARLVPERVLLWHGLQTC